MKRTNQAKLTRQLARSLLFKVIFLMPKRRLIIIFFLLITAAIGWYWQDNIASSLVQNSCKIYCRLFLNSTLSYKGIKVEDGNWVFDHPALTSVKSLEKGGFSLQAEKVSMRANVLFSARKLGVLAFFTDLKVDVGDGAKELKKLLKRLNFGTSSSLFHVNANVSIPNGQMFFHPKNGKPVPPFQFQVESTSSLTSLQVWLKSRILASLEIALTFSENTHLQTPSFLLECNFKETPLSSLGDILEAISPDSLPCEILRGSIDGTMKARFAKDSSPVAEGKLFAKDLLISYPLYGALAEIPGLSIDNFILDVLAEKPLTTLNADLDILLGTITLNGNAVKKEAEENLLQIKNIKTALKVRGGILQKSIAYGDIAGVKGNIQLDGTGTGPSASFNFEGALKGLLPYLPNENRRAIAQNFGGDQIMLFGKVNKHDAEFRVNGEVLLSSECGEGVKIPFGVHINLNTEKEEGVSKSPFDGWFKIDHLVLRKYLSPLMFTRDELFLSGIGEVQGTFNEKGCDVKYDARDMVLENQYLTCELKSISGEEPTSPTRFKGTFSLDFETGRTNAGYAIINGTYFEKATGLLFTDIYALLKVTDGHAHLSNVEACCNGIFFSDGALHADWSKPGDGVFAFDISAKTMQGKLSQVQDIFLHFPKPLFLSKIPLEGNVDFSPKGGYLKMRFWKEDYDFEALCEGAITDGFLTSKVADIALQEVSMNFQYDHLANTLDFTDLQGTLLVGAKDQMEEYAIGSEQLYFSDFENNVMEFDVWVGNKDRNILRAVGSTKQVLSQDGSYIEVSLDKSLSHFGKAYPTDFSLSMTDLCQLKDFHLEFDFKLHSLLKDLQRLGRTGLFYLPKSIMKTFNDLPYAQGGFKAVLDYSDKDDLFLYYIAGERLRILSHECDQFILTGKKKGNLWSVGQLQLDEISLALDVQRKDDTLDIQFLGGRFGNTLLFGMEGRYDLKKMVVDAKVNLLEVDLKEFGKEKVQSLEGKFHAVGDIQIKVDPTLPKGLSVEVHGKGSLKGARIKDFALNDISDISFQYDLESGVNIKNMATSIHSIVDGARLIDLHLQRIKGDLPRDTFIVEGLSFNLPSSQLPWLVNTFKQKFPSLLPSFAENQLKHLKQSGNVEGEVFLTYSALGPSMRVSLKDDIYRFLDKEYPLKDFAFEYTPSAIKASTLYTIGKEVVQLSMHSAFKNLESGQLTLQPLKVEGAYPDSLALKWKVDPNHGYYIEEIRGKLHGICCNLAQNFQKPLEDNSLKMIGHVELDFTKAKNLFEPSIAEALTNYGIGKGYSLEGELNIDKDDTKEWADRLTFQGTLFGSEFTFLGYTFSHFFADLDHSSDLTTLKRLQLIDPSLTVALPTLAFASKAKGVMVPSLEVTNFRPALLRKISGKTPYQSRSLVVERMDIHDLTGILGERKSFSGKGSLSFSNPPKMGLKHTIFAIPAEILTRIGLDLDVLTPVCGNIDFFIEDEKVVLKRFKDMYSKKKVSKFALRNGAGPSYLDFDGNLNLAVKMKQYNLIFKLAELFTVSVQGTIWKPTYSLRKIDSKGG